MIDGLAKLLMQLKQKPLGSKIYRPSKGYVSLDFDKKNYVELSAKAGFNGWFLDGGSSLLFSGADFGLGFIRVFAIHYPDKKMIRKEGLCLITTQMSEGKLHYLITSSDFESIKVDAFDLRISNQGRRATMDSTLDLFRKICEQRLCSTLDFVIWDMELDVYDFANEFVILSKNIWGLSKTSSLLTDSGSSYLSLLETNAPFDSWVYFPSLSSDSNHPKVYFVKLHPKSKHIFRLDTFSDSAFEILMQLAYLSKDPIFLGYPYPLIFADKMARISKQDSQRKKVQLAVKFAKALKGTSVNSKNAHEILDRVNVR